MVGRRHACEDNNKIDLKGAGCVNVNWIRLAPMGTSKYSTEIVDSIKERVFFLLVVPLLASQGEIFSVVLDLPTNQQKVSDSHVQIQTHLCRSGEP